MATEENNSGWIALHRSIGTHWLWEDRPFSRGQAWIDLLLMVNHKARRLPVDGEMTTIERGAVLTSLRKLSERWGWSRKKTATFLDLLEADGMISQKRATRYTTIKALKYSDFQDVQEKKEPVKSRERTTKEPPKSHEGTVKEPLGSRSGASEEPLRNTNNNVNNDNNDNKIERYPPISPNGDISPQGEKPPAPKAPKQPKAKKTAYGEFGKVQLTEEEHTKLVQRLGENETRGYIDRLDGYVASTGKQYSSHYATILSWWRKDGEKPGSSPCSRPKGDRSFASSSFDAKELQDRLLADFMATPLPGEEAP